MALRDTATALAPPFLQKDDAPINGAPMGVGGRYMYNIGLAGDALLEKMNQANRARMPTVCDVSALPLIGNDRVMAQGPGEATGAFRIRLQRAFETWQHAGEARAVLEQAASYMLGQVPDPSGSDRPLCAIVGGYNALKWDWFMNVDDTTLSPTHLNNPGAWSWDGTETVRWWRSWLVMFFFLSPAEASGTAASITTQTGGLQTVTGLTGMLGSTSLESPGYLRISNTTHPENAGTFQIFEALSATSVVIANPDGIAADPSSGAIHWSLARFPGVQPTPVCDAPGTVVEGPGRESVGVMMGDGSSAAGYFTQLRAQLHLWKSGQTFYPNIIVSYGGGDQSAGYEFSPNSTEGNGNPDGTWGEMFVIRDGKYAPARQTDNALSEFNAYCDGTQIYRNCYQPST